MLNLLLWFRYVSDVWNEIKLKVKMAVGNIEFGKLVLLLC